MKLLKKQDSMNEIIETEQNLTEESKYIDNMLMLMDLSTKCSAKLLLV